MKKRKSKSNRHGLGTLCVVLLMALVILLAIAKSLPEFAVHTPTEAATQLSTEPPTNAPTEPPTEAPTETSTEAPAETPTEAPVETPTEMPTEAPTTAPTETPTEPSIQKLVVIDAGHQLKGNYDKEPVGPGATELKSKVTSGTQGIATGLEEYQLNLTVAKKLQAILESRGYEVVMVRTTHDVDISNAERAQIANELQADAFIRIHANSSDNPESNGILTICQTKENPYNSDLYSASYLLSEAVLEEMVASTGAKRLYIWETNTMSGINWCQVPVTIVEMGFMSNEAEDRKMATDAYQELLAQGIANGIDRYFENIG